MTKLELLEKEIETLRNNVVKQKKEFLEAFEKDPCEAIRFACSKGVNKIGFLQMLKDNNGYTLQLLLTFEDNSTIIVSVNNPDMSIL